MADGKVVIDIILNDGTVAKGVANLDKSLVGVAGSGQTAALGIGKIATALGLVKIASVAINMVKQSLDGAISRYDTLNNFPRVLQLLGFDAQSSEKAINRLSEGIDGLPTTLDSVASTAQRIAGMTGDLDGAVETTLALNNAFLASGSSSADAQRGLEQYVQMLAKGEVDLQSFRSLQETMPIALNKVAEAFGMTGASAQNDLYDALKKGDITFDQFNGKLIELSNATGGFADMAKESTGGIATSWQNMKTAVVKGVADVIGAIDKSLGGVGSIAGIIDVFKSKIQQAFSWIVENIPMVIRTLKDVYNAIEPWLPLIGAAIAGIIGFKTTISIIKTVNDTISMVKNAFALLNATILANPIALVIAAIIAAAVLVFIYWEPIKEFFVNLWTVIKDAGLSIWESLKSAWIAAVGAIKNTWSTVTDFFLNLWESIKNTATSIWDGLNAVWDSAVNQIKLIWGTITNFFSELWSGIVSVVMIILEPFVLGVTNIFNNIKEGIALVFEGIKLYFQGVWELIKNIFLGAILLIVNLVTGNFEELKSNAIQIWENIKNALSMIWDGIGSVFLGALEAIVGFVKGYWENVKSTTTIVFDAIKTFITFLWENIKTFFSNTLSSIVSTAKQSWENIKNATTTAFNIVKTTISNIWEGIKNFFTVTLVNIANTVKQKFTDIVNSIRDKMNEVKGKVEDGWNKAKKFLENINLKQMGKDIIQGLINGIKSKIEAVGNAIKSVTDKITGKIKSILKISSPSKLFEQFGGWLSEGLSIGIDKEARGAIKSSENLATGVSDAYKPDITNRLRGIVTPISGRRIAYAGGGGVFNSTSKTEKHTTQNDNGTLVTGNTFVVRNESDIEKIAIEINKLRVRKNRGLRGATT